MKIFQSWVRGGLVVVRSSGLLLGCLSKQSVPSGTVLGTPPSLSHSRVEFSQATVVVGSNDLCQAFDDR